jgi:uncharacterized protein (DUF58 family)
VIRINKPGYIYIILTILIGFSAVNTANNLLYIVTSALLSYLLISGIFGRKNLRGIDVSLEFPDERFAETDIPIGIKLTNKRKFVPAFLIRIWIDDKEVLFPVVGARSSALLYLNMAFENRGMHLITEIVVASVFPFNFFTRYRRLPQNLELTIFPKLRRCPLNYLLASRTRWKGDSSADVPGYDSDILSIRDYVSGDPVKYISWKATAKTGVLKTKELSAVASPNIVIDFDKLEKHDLEETISHVAFMIVKLIQSGTAVGLIINGETHTPDFSSSHKLALLTRLALHGQN